MLKQVAEGVLIHQSELLENNSVVVQGRDGVLLVDAGITGAEMTCLANDLRELGRPVAAGFSRHPEGVADESMSSSPDMDPSPGMGRYAQGSNWIERTWRTCVTPGCPATHGSYRPNPAGSGQAAFTTGRPVSSPDEARQGTPDQRATNGQATGHRDTVVAASREAIEVLATTIAPTLPLARRPASVHPHQLALWTPFAPNRAAEQDPSSTRPAHS
jgi:hypothetical protein